MSSFYTLSAQRGQGMSGLAPLSFVDIQAYLAIYPWYDMPLFIKYVCLLDRKFLHFHYEKNERKRKASTNKKPK